MPARTARERREERRLHLASETVRRAVAAATTRTTTESESGALAPTAPPTSSTSASGKMPMQPTLARIQDQTGTISQLQAWAAEYPNEMRAAVFVARAFAETPNPQPRKRFEAFEDGRLGLRAVQAFAREWDSMGRSTPAEFVEALACETNGHPKGEAVSSILRDVSDTSQNISQVDSETEWA